MVIDKDKAARANQEDEIEKVQESLRFVGEQLADFKIET